MVQDLLEYLKYFVGSQRALRNQWPIDPPLCRLNHDCRVQSMAVLCPWQVYLPRLEDRVELHLRHQIGHRRAH